MKTDPENIRGYKRVCQSGELIKSDNAEPKAIKYYKQKGIRMKKCKKFSGSRYVYTKKVKRFKKIICSDECHNTVDELQELTFKVDKDGGDYRR